MDLSKISTKELVEELGTREAVERVEVGVENALEIVVQRGTSLTGPDFLYDKMTDGPQIVLRIWD